MEFFYLACLIFSVGMLFWLKIYDVRNSVTQFITLLIIVVSNLGFYFASIATTLEEALMAQKIAYVGGIFLPVFYFLIILDICHVNINRLISSALLFIQFVLFGFVCTIGRNKLFYKGATLIFKNGAPILQKDYGIVHSIYLATVYIYLALAVVVVIHSLIKKKSVDRRGAWVMICMSLITVFMYVFEKVMQLNFEVMPITFNVLMIGILIPIYDSNIYTVYKNEDIIEEQLNKIGFLTFNKKGIYKGCDEYMERVFPELKAYRLGQKITNCSDELKALINKVSVLENLYNESSSKEHMHFDFEAFKLNDRFYAGTVHVVANAFGVLKGYTIELRDETEHYNTLALREHYAEELSKEVSAKTKRIRRIQQKIIMGMAQMVESRDLSTGGHIKRTSDVVRIFARKLEKENLGLDHRFLSLVIRSAPMHDIGKIGVDDAILRKQARFTDDEYNQMKKHSEIGFKMVREILSDVEEPDFVAIAENVAHYHHEKVNGTGYPSGLKGDEIPVEARIMALADVFDALVSKRCYKEAFSYDKAFSIIKNDAGSHFDAKLASVFLECRSELEEYYNRSAE